MWRCQFLCYVLKTLFFVKIAPKLIFLFVAPKLIAPKLFLQKNAKVSSAGGSAPRPPGSGSWGLRSLTAIGLQRPGLLLQAPKLAPPLRISGYAPIYIAAKRVACCQLCRYLLRVRKLQLLSARSTFRSKLDEIIAGAWSLTISPKLQEMFCNAVDW